MPLSRRLSTSLISRYPCEPDPHAKRSSHCGAIAVVYAAANPPAIAPQVAITAPPKTSPNDRLLKADASWVYSVEDCTPNRHDRTPASITLEYRMKVSRSLAYMIICQ